jgi:hypothetical protein
MHRLTLPPATKIEKIHLSLFNNSILRMRMLLLYFGSKHSRKGDQTERKKLRLSPFVPGLATPRRGRHRRDSSESSFVTRLFLRVHRLYRNRRQQLWQCTGRVKADALEKRKTYGALWNRPYQCSDLVLRLVQRVQQRETGGMFLLCRAVEE